MSITQTQLKAAFHKHYPTRDWNQSCQAAVAWAAQWTSGKGSHFYLSANEAYRASKIVSKDAKRAPLNAVHYWAIGTYGHVAVGLGGSKVLMASSHIDTAWAKNLGVTTVERYSARTGARYLGWSNGNGTNRVALKAPPAPKPSDADNVKKLSRYLNGRGLGKRTTAQYDGIRGKVYWTLVQLAGRKDGLYGAGYVVDGKPDGAGSRTRWLEKHYLAKA